MHGWGGDYNNFYSSILALKSLYTCVNVSLFDVENPKPLTLDDYVKFVNDIIGELKKEYGIKSIILVGHSFGGRIALRLARLGYVDRLVLVDSAGLRPKIKLTHIIRKLKFKIVKMLKLDTSTCGSPDYRRLSPTMRATFNNIVRLYQDDELEFIDVPTFIYWGEKDNETPLYMAKRFKKGIKNSGLFVLKGAGHYSYLESPTFIIGLKNFINSR